MKTAGSILEELKILNFTMGENSAPESEIDISVYIQEFHVIVFVPQSACFCLHLQLAVASDDEQTLIPRQPVFPRQGREILTGGHVIRVSILGNPPIEIVMDVIHPIRDHITWIENGIVILYFPFNQASVWSTGKPDTA
jgi:hypothetical protein